MNAEWVELDFYAMLDVSPDVDVAVIKRAYRRLAQEFHPDANPGDANAEERFKDIARAYGVLSDVRRRALYDQVRAGADPDELAAASGFDTLEDLATATGAILGRHIVTPVTVPLEHVAVGATVRVAVDGRDDIEVAISPGVADGEIVRLEGKGNVENGVTGDLILIVHVPRHDVFGREGDHILTRHQIGVTEAAMGTTTVVATPHGPVSLTVPPGTVAGAKFSIEGYGVRHRSGHRGDLILTIEVASSDRMRPDATRGSFSGLIETLDERDLDVIPTTGQYFDPALHEAVGKVEAGPGRLVVTGEVRRGYRVRGQVIRPALVTVAYREEEPT
jgi:molecular chaperone DnaJ